MGKPFKLANGLLLLSTEAPGGVYNSTQLKKIAQLCDGDSSVVKATEDQRLAIFVASDKAAKVAAELKAVGLGVRHYQDGLHQPVNCLGEMCPEHLQDALGMSMELTKELAGITLGTPLKIGINGCARGCVATHTLDISIIGDTNGYRVSLGGKNSQLPEMASFMAEGVPAAKLPKLIAKVVSVYKELAQKDETLQEVTERAGTKKFIEALAPYSQDAHQDDPFSGLGESSADGGAAGPEIEADFGDAPEKGGPGVEDPSEEIGASGLDLDMGESETTEAGGELAMDDSGDAGDLSLDDAGAGELAMTDDAGNGELSMTDDADLSSDGELSMTDDAVELSSGDELSMTDDAVLSDDAALSSDGDLAMTEDAGELSMTDDVGELTMTDDAGNGELSMTDDTALIDTGDGELSLTDDAGDLTLDDSAPATGAEDLEELSLEDMPAKAAAPKPAAAAKPVAAAPAAETDADELTADEVSDAEADAFEEKLNASIAEEEAYPELEDANSLDRLEAMKLVEEGGDEQVHESLASASFDNLEIDHDEEVFVDDQGTPAMPAATHGSAVFEFVGFDLSGERVTLNFSSGAAVAIDPRLIAQNSRRDLTVGGKKISVGHVDGGLEVEVDGVAIFLPKRAA